MASAQPHPVATLLTAYQTGMSVGGVLVAATTWLVSRRATVLLNSGAD